MLTQKREIIGITHNGGGAATIHSPWVIYGLFSGVAGKQELSDNICEIWEIVS